MMFKAFLIGSALALSAQSALAKIDPRSDDAVAAFGDLCVSLFTETKKPGVDPTRFNITKLAEETAKSIKPDVKGALWDVSGTRSDVHMLVHYEPQGLCVVEVAEADEASIRSRFEELVQQTAVTLASPAKREVDKLNRIDGKDATTSMWRMKGAKGDLMLAVTTYPDAKFMIQHLMTVSYVK